MLITILLVCAALANVALIGCLISCLKELNKLIKISKAPLPSQIEKKKEEPKKELPNDEVDSRATNAERLFQEGIQSILSYDVNVMKQYLKGVEDE